MSLIHDALRKARREAGEEEQRGLVYARGLTGGRRSVGLGRGILLGAALVLLAGAVVGGVLWLRTQAAARSAARVAISGTESRHHVDAPSGTPSPAGRQTPEQVEASPTAPAGRTTATTEVQATATKQPEGSAGHDVEATSVDTTAPSPIDPVALPRPTPRMTAPTGERVFDVEADLGYAVLTLDYIAFRATDPFAQINGRDVRVGSTVEGFTVEEIGPSSVRLRDPRGPLVLRVP